MSAAVSYLQEQFILPPPAVRQVIQHFILLTVEAGAAPTVRTLLPHFQVVLLINLGPIAEIWSVSEATVVPVRRVQGMVVTGPVKTALQYRLPGGARVLAITFTLDGFYRLFRVPVAELQGQFVDPDSLVEHRGFAQLWEKLQPLQQPAELAQAITNFCLPYLRTPENPQLELVAHLPLLAQSRYLNPLKVMAAASKLSERTLQLRFQRYLGFSAKEVTRFLRFRQVIEVLQQRGGAVAKEDWLALLEQYGYYDQSHLIHDFTHFLQQSPTKVSVQLLQGDAICFTRTELL